MVRVRRRRKDEAAPRSERAERVEAVDSEAPEAPGRSTPAARPVAQGAPHAAREAAVEEGAAQAAQGAPGRRPPGRRARYEAWDAGRVRALRRHMGFTQQQLSDELGTRQQTVSEWETGVYQPRGASARLLTLVAERAGFRYNESGLGGNGTKTDGQDGREDGRAAGQ
jgi:DNA-binding transcriptional regulator YiaG